MMYVLMNTTKLTASPFVPTNRAALDGANCLQLLPNDINGGNIVCTPNAPTSGGVGLVLKKNDICLCG